MKKTLITIGICLFIIGMPLTNAIFPKITNQLNEKNQNITKFYSTDNDPPEWATNYFIGVIGVTDVNGKPQPYTGYIAGYCEDDFKGRFFGILTEDIESEPKGFIGGRIVGLFLLGIISNYSGNQQTFIAGLGLKNETHFYFRLMGIIGPTFYITGKFSPL